MKKTFLTFLAVGFGVSVAFAQTEISVDEPQADAQLEQMEPSVHMYQDHESRTKVEMAALPAATQEAFQNGQYSDMEVLAIYEVPAESGTEATVYEFELVQKTDGAEATEMEGVEIEKVNDRQPDLILVIDENGQVVEEKQADEVE